MTLRRRLVLSIVALVVAVSAVIGGGSIIALFSIQRSAIDEQLQYATTRAQRSVEQQGPNGPEFGRPSAQSAGTLTVYILDGNAVVGSLLDNSGQAERLSTAVVRPLSGLAVDGQPHTIDLGSDLGRYRVTAANVGPAVLVVGLPLAPVYESVWKLLGVVLVVTVLALLVASAVATAAVRRALRPLDRVAETASTVARMPLERSDALDGVRVPDTDPRTEVGRVGASLNRMLGHVEGALEARQQSENKVRQFVADASHELRTPLASVRGYAELTRRMGAGLPDDVVYAMGRIESESLRMTSLVEDLLLLARLDEGRDIVVADVDLTRVVLDAVNDAGVADPAHDVDVVLPDEPVVVPGDAMRLHQIVANLLTNSRTHTPEGTPVHVALGVDEAARRAVVTVSDEGPGIDPAVLPVLFERFARADSSRSRKAGSTGLGLAIVEAVAHAHGGDVSVASSADGAVFTVRLPLAAPPASAV